MDRSNPSIMVFCVKSAWRSFVFSYRAWSCLTTSRTSVNAFSSNSSAVARVGNGNRLNAHTSTPPTTHVQFHFFTIPIARGVAKAALYCAHRTSTSFTVRVLRARRAPSRSPHTPSSAPTGPVRPTTSLRPSRPAAPTRPSASICSIIRAARGYPTRSRR